MLCPHDGGDLHGIASGEHWTGSPNKDVDQIGKNCPENVRKLRSRPLRTIFRTCCRHSLFLGVQRFARHNLSGVVSCDSDADSNRAMPTAIQMSKTQTLRNKGPFFPPLPPVGSRESVLKMPTRGQFHAAICGRNVASRVPNEH